MKNFYKFILDTTDNKKGPPQNGEPQLKTNNYEEERKKA